MKMPTRLLAAAIVLAGLVGACTRHDSRRAVDSNAEVMVSTADLDTTEPGIATDSDGNLYVVYVERVADKSADLYLQKFDSSLRRTGERTRINPEPGTVRAWYGDPPTVKISPDKSILIGWTIRAGTGTNYVLSISGDSGATFSSPTKINDDVAPASHGMHSLAIANDGTVYAAWLDERNVKAQEPTPLNASGNSQEGFHFVKADHVAAQSAEAAEPNSEVFFAFSKDGGKSFSKNQKISSDVCPCCKTAITIDESGRVYISWRQVLDGDFRHIAVAASTDSGNSFSLGTIVSDDKWHIMACPVSGAAIAGEPSGLDVVWYTAGSEGQPGYYFARSVDASAKFSPRNFISSDAETGTPTLLRTGTGMMVVYQGADNKTVIATANGESGFSTSTTIEAASNPVAVVMNGTTYIAFVRNENKKRSVWIGKR